MPKHLVIVESPTKAKTIKRFLGSDFLVEACMGHVRDLPGNNLAVDVDAGFEAEYVIPDEKKSVVKGLQKYLDTCDELWIATDEDREGEAIGWHLTQVLRRKNGQEIRRIVFHEITEEAIRDAARHPREIDERLVEAQVGLQEVDMQQGPQVVQAAGRLHAFPFSLEEGVPGTLGRPRTVRRGAHHR